MLAQFPLQSKPLAEAVDNHGALADGAVNTVSWLRASE
jgi:hypothetical protein